MRRTPPEPERRHVYVYDVQLLDGELIVTGSTDPETDLARALLARGIVGVLELLDAVTGKPRTIIHIENAAKIRTAEDRNRGPRFVKWREGGVCGRSSPDGIVGGAP
jgi:hypothetical protein